MPKHISEININSYRGIKDLSIKDLGNINIIVGDNNCGKTSFLEALQILSNPSSFEDIVSVARQRERFIFSTRTMYSSLIDIFDKSSSDLMIDINCKYNNSISSVKLHGAIENIMLNDDDLRYENYFIPEKESIIDEETEAFIGTLKYIQEFSLTDTNINKSEENVDVHFNKRVRGIRKRKKTEMFPVKALSPVDHLMYNTSTRITKDSRMLDSLITILQNCFDENIEDYRIIEGENRGHDSVLVHKELGFMPLSTYGDGVKKVIAIASAAALIENGIFLIDEFETFIHTSAMEKVFKMLADVSNERNLQLFVTTHNIEAVEKLIEVNQEEQENIRVITLYKKENQTVARILNGKEALEAKNELGLELR